MSGSPFPGGVFAGAVPYRRVLRSRRLVWVQSTLRRLAGSAPFVEDEVLGLDDVVGSGDVCFDVGAEYGLYSYVLAHRVGPEGVVHSVEPQPGPMRALRVGLRAAGCRNVRCHQVALGRKAGPGVLHLPTRRGLPVHGRAFLSEGARERGPNREFSGERRIGIQMTTLDALRAALGVERVDFIKADVEGAELALLEGARQTLETCRPTLMLEIEERHLTKYGAGAGDLIDWLAGLGYVMHVWRAGAWRATEDLVSARRNYLFTMRQVDG